MFLAICEWLQPFRAPDDGGAGGGAGGEGEGGGAGEGGGGAQGAEGAGDGGGGETSDASSDTRPWYDREGALDGPTRDFMKSKGMLVDDLDRVRDQAVKGWMAAEKFIGKGADTLMEKPAEGQELADWMRGNREMFGLPEAPEGYELKQPEMPDGLAWDEGLEGKFRARAHDLALTPEQLQGLTDLYAAHQVEDFQAVAQEQKDAQQAALAEVQRAYGDQFAAKMEMAKQGLAAVAEKAGLDAETQSNAMTLLGEKTTEASVLRMFAAVGEMLGDDAFVPGGGGPGSMTREDAQAELAQFTSRDGEYGKAFAAGDKAELKRLEPRRQTLIKASAGKR